MNRSCRLLAAAFTVVAVLGAVAFASAASLPVSPGAMTSRTAERPCDNGATATAPAGSGPTYTEVRLTVPPNCVNRSVQVTLVDGGGVAHSSVSTVMASATQDVAVSSYTAAAGLTVGATVDSWNLTTTWSYTPPPYISCRIVNTQGAACSVSAFSITQGNWFEEIVNPDYHMVNVTITTTGATASSVWELTMQFDDTHYETVPRYIGGPTNVTSATACGDLPVYRVQGSDVGSGSRALTFHIDSVLANRQNLLGPCG